VVCSACGYENQEAMRYCVMCGTPLPHRPLTTPGAQSTLNFTRVPVESGSTASDLGTSNTGSSSIGVLEPSSGNGRTPTADTLTLPTTTSATEPAQVEVHAPPPTELVPDVSLDEYIQKFRYEPPSDPGEVTMLGDAPPMVETEAPSATADAPTAPDAVPVGTTPEATYPPAGPVLVARSRSDREEVVATDVPADSVASRLGLEPESPAEERIQRPRFLDVNEPSKESQPAASSGTSTIVGPSFLGLSDPPLIDMELTPQEEEGPSTGRWRGWLATAILVLFAVLGVMEWRSQANLTNQGMLQVISAKLHSWRHAASSAAGGDTSSTAPAASDANSKPDMQVQPQSEPAKPAGDQTAASNPPPSPTASTASTPTPAAGPPDTSSLLAHSPANSATPRQTVDSSPKTAPPAESTTKNPSASTSQPAKPSASVAKADANGAPRKPAGDQTPAAKPVSGADEMARAKNASDAAASAAWLWKATAKGNPDAPVQLADLYIKGEGVPRSCEQAMVLLKTAAAKENAAARNRLGSLYATGNCVPRNRVEAYHWMSAALTANPNSQWAQQNRDQIWRQMTPEEQAAAQRYR
jgi:Sel1 repeat